MDGWAVLDLPSVPLGPEMTSASLEEVLAALRGFDPAQGWEMVRDRVIPLFQRVRPYPAEFPEAVRMILPPGLSVSFALDMGPAFTHISEASLRRWGVSPSEVRDTALANLDRRAQDAASLALVTEPVDGVPLRTLQSGTGSASTFVLVPHRLAAIFGTAPQYFIAPMRDVLISLPADVDRGFAAWLMAEFAEMDPNHLAPVGFLYRGGSVTVEPLGEAMAMA
jgi:uncharacterized protein YtpQ (UPF0354 family)